MSDKLTNDWVADEGDECRACGKKLAKDQLVWSTGRGPVFCSRKCAEHGDPKMRAFIERMMGNKDPGTLHGLGALLTGDLIRSELWVLGTTLHRWRKKLEQTYARYRTDNAERNVELFRKQTLGNHIKAIAALQLQIATLLQPVNKSRNPRVRAEQIAKKTYKLSHTVLNMVLDKYRHQYKMSDDFMATLEAIDRVIEAVETTRLNEQRREYEEQERRR